MELTRDTHTSLDITSEAEVLSYTYSGLTTLMVSNRIEVGSTGKPIAGNGIYTVALYVDDVPYTPSSNIQVPAGQESLVFQSRLFVLEPGDVVSIRVTGQAGDDDVFAESILFDMTPATLDQLVGSGDITVDHNYGGTDNLRIVTPAGAGISDANIVAYLEADYVAARTGRDYIRGRTITKGDGRWNQPMGLAAGDYRLVISKSGHYATQTRQIEVTA